MACKPRVLCLVFLSSLFFLSCGSVYRIRRAATPTSTAQPPKLEKQQGVLYYVKVGVCRHETKYEEPIFDVVVANTTTKALELQRSLGLKAYQDFQTKLSNPSADAKRELNNEPTYMPTDLRNVPLSDNLLLVANRNLAEAVVDYRHDYYYNVKKPVSGSSTADIKLASDGTMTEASATVQSDTLKTILSAIPTQTILSAVLAVDGGHPSYTVTVTQRLYTWTISAMPVSVLSDETLKQCPGPGSPIGVSAETLGQNNITKELITMADTAKAPAGPTSPK